ncbi:PSP1 C-terminal conserved region-domain-containing protein [Pilobolus umbonatus]|nr:PSP1 C-terminal conserved region-domain-containing protein [Pilobolus umbonatus]
MSQPLNKQPMEESSSSSAMKSPVLDNAWKAVGSPSRRGSAVNIPLMSDSKKANDSPVDNMNPMRRSSVIADLPPASSVPASNVPSNLATINASGSQWGSFGGFQWEGPSIFEEDGKTVGIPPSQPAPDVIDSGMSLYNNNSPYESSILSVPMLPGVSLEPIYRQQRSLSFSMGQDPTFFGYDDYDEPPQQQLFKTSLATMEEEDDLLDEIDLSHIRSRSKSSGAAFGLLSQAQHSRLMNSHLRRGSEQQDEILSQRRRSSSRFFNGNVPDQQFSQMSLGDKERLDLLQRRLSQQNQDFIFPENTGFNIMNQRRQSLTLNTQPASNIQQLADQLESTHLRSEIPLGFPPSSQPPYRSELFAPPNFNPTPYQHFQQQQQQQQQQQVQVQQQVQQQQQQQQQQHLHNHQIQQQSSTSHQQTDEYFEADSRGFQDLGKGVPLHRLDPKLPLYMVEFKSGRMDFFYVLDSHQFSPQIEDLVIVEADRGKDLGKVTMNTLTIEQVTELEQRRQLQLQQLEHNDKEEEAAAKPQREIHIKRIFRLATPDEVNLLMTKGQDENKALVMCQQKTKQRKLPMEVVDAEYQWDRRKLTFYFEAEHRIDFRELVRELFKIYKTRIWMCVVTPPLNLDQISSKHD